MRSGLLHGGRRQILCKSYLYLIACRQLNRIRAGLMIWKPSFEVPVEDSTQPAPKTAKGKLMVASMTQLSAR